MIKDIAVVFDTNAYRDICNRRNIADPTNELKKCDQQLKKYNITAFSNPFVIMELASHLADTAEKIADRLKSVAIAAGVGSDEAIEPEGEQRLLAQSMDEALSSPLLADGRVRYRLRKPWPTPDGAETLVLDPVRFLKRITALMSRPYVNNVRYHGVFANRSKDRPRLPPPPSLISQVPASSAPGPLHNAAADVTPPFEPLPTPTKHRRTPWAQLLKRTLHLDALKCPRCSESMEVLALITDPPVVRNILNHLHLPDDDPLPSFPFL